MIRTLANCKGEANGQQNTFDFIIRSCASALGPLNLDFFVTAADPAFPAEIPLPEMPDAPS